MTPPPTARSLGARWVEAANVVGAIVVLVPALVLGVTLFLTLGPSWPMAAAGLVAAAALWGAGWVALRRYHSAFFATARWTLGHDELVWRHGVWWRKVVTVPRSRVQHTDVSQGPFARRHGLATLVVHTAGTSHATVTLEGLDAFDARSIRDHLLTVGAADDAV